MNARDSHGGAPRDNELLHALIQPSTPIMKLLFSLQTLVDQICAVTYSCNMAYDRHCEKRRLHANVLSFVHPSASRHAFIKISETEICRPVAHVLTS